MNKPFFAEGTEAMLQLEAMVDKVGVSNVLHALAYIAGQKAAHIETNWQDASSAKAWQERANKIGALTNKVHAPLGY